MALIINTADIDLLETLDADQIHWVYNAFDVCITAQVKQGIEKNMDEVAINTYDQALKWQAPFLDMMLQGVPVDTKKRDELKTKLMKDIKQLEAQLEELLVDGMGLPSTINARSPTDVKQLFYNIMGIKERKQRNVHGHYTASVSREILESIAVQHFYAEPIVNHILAIRDAGKSLGFLKTPLDEDGNMRCSFNLAGTNTGRCNSTVSNFGTGTNLQNVDTQLRYMFVAPKGRKFINVDLEQADSRNVGALAWNRFYESHGEDFAGSYLDACESGDLHTTVCRMAWLKLNWGDDPDLWRGVADQIAYRGLSYRDLAKKLGHGTNYLGQPPTMAKHTKVQVQAIIEFQTAYFAAFPCIPLWQEETLKELTETGMLTNLFGRRRMFFGRHDDTSVKNAAIAYAPQGSTGEEINHGIHALWNHADGKWFKLHIQVHDSILFSVPEEAADELTPLSVQLMKKTIPLAGGRLFHVPLEAQVGWNWGYQQKDKKTGKVIGNYHGLIGWNGEDKRVPPSHITAKPLSIWDAY